MMYPSLSITSRTFHSDREKTRTDSTGAVPQFPRPSVSFIINVYNCRKMILSIL